MPRAITDSESLAPDDGLPDGLDYRREKSQIQKCKRKRARSIRSGIDNYFERKTLKNELGDDFDDDEFDDGLNDPSEEDSWYH